MNKIKKLAREIEKGRRRRERDREVEEK